MRACVEISYADMKRLIDACFVFRELISSKNDPTMIMRINERTGLSMLLNCLGDSTLFMNTNSCTKQGSGEIGISARGFLNACSTIMGGNVEIEINGRSARIDNENQRRVFKNTPGGKEILFVKQHHNASLSEHDLRLLNLAKMFYGTDPGRDNGISICHGYAVACGPQNTFIAKTSSRIDGIYIPNSSLQIKDILCPDKGMGIKWDHDFLSLSCDKWELVRRHISHQKPLEVLKSLGNKPATKMYIKSEVLRNGIIGLDNGSNVTMEISQNNLRIAERNVSCIVTGNQISETFKVVTKKSLLAAALSVMCSEYTKISWFPDFSALLLSDKENHIYCGLCATLVR